MKTDRVTRWLGITLIVGYTGLAITEVVFDRPWLAVGYATIAVPFVTFFMLRRLWIKVGFARGYHAYRQEVLSRVTEARERGMSPEDWFGTEIERALGIVRVPYPEE